MANDGGGAPFSVIVPAYNEASVIGRCLEALYRGAPAGAEPEVVVVCNGCRDATADAARTAARFARVIELAEGSKPNALNAGNAAAHALPRFFVDADVVAPYAALCAAAGALREAGVGAAAPALAVDCTGCSDGVRRYYRVWLRQPYATQAMVGSGVYGLSAAGLARVGSFPAIIADDGYVRSRFSREERRSVAMAADGTPVAFTIFPPRRLGELVRIESRRRAGDAQLAALPGAREAGRSTSGGSLRAGLGKDYGLADLAVYLAVKFAGRAHFAWSRMRGSGLAWRRDESSRAAA